MITGTDNDQRDFEKFSGSDGIRTRYLQVTSHCQRRLLSVIVVALRMVLIYIPYVFANI